ncbi:MAG: hypothetical protein KIT89_10020 [Microcella sp.]|uniref:DUF6049 family protein n=1 Tax=Microcella sp. TaxID=1913979 RepID=UPI0024C622A4|nr:DUF6049 family protein [Microcella sp.]UYN83036.1 MAG: hypothetical protein KIT89_10020 [Microcella sp.]
MAAVRERRGRRAFTRQSSFWALALSGALLWGAALPASATTSDPASEPVLEVIAAPSGSGAVREGQALSVRVTLSNDGGRTNGALDVALTIDGSRAAEQTELAAWFSSDDDIGLAELSPSTIETLSPIDAGASAVLDLTVSAGSALWQGPFGPRLAEVTVTDRTSGTVVARDRTSVVWVPADTAIPVASTVFVAALSTPESTEALLTADTLATLTSETGSLSRTLSAVTGRPVLLAIDPRIIASIRVLGEQAPPSALDFLERLAAAPNESFLLPWADADAVAALAATESPLPRPEGTGVAVAALELEGSGATADPDDQSSDAALTQSLAELLEWPVTFEHALWPAAEGLTAESLDALAAAGTRLVLTPSTVLGSLSAVQQRGDVTLLRADEALSTAARAASHAPSQQRFDSAMARVSALVAASAAPGTSTAVVIALDREAVVGSDRVLDTVSQTIALPWSTGSTVSSAITGRAAAATIVDRPVDEVRSTAIRAAVAAEAADRRFAQIALTPGAISDVRRLELLSALSLGWGDDSVAALERFVDASSRLRSSVNVAESSAILLLSDRASIPVTVQNDLDVAVRVYVNVDPDTAQLRVLDPQVETLVEPQSQTRVVVPVESLTNGEVDITVTVQDADGRSLSTPTRVSLNLQAGWETAGTIVVALAVAGLFVTGIVRDVRKRRRRQAAADPADPSEVTST